MKAGLLFLILLLALGGCITTRSLEDGEKLLYKQYIKGTEESNRAEMFDLIILEPNSRTPIFGPLGAYLYQQGLDDYDTTIINQRKKAMITRLDKKATKKTAKGKSTDGLDRKKARRLGRLNNQLINGNFLMRTGTPLAIYDSAKIEQSRQNIKAYLDRKGFIESEVSVNIRERKKKIFQDFVIKEGERRFIDSLDYRTGDSIITRLLINNQGPSFLTKGGFYDEDNFTNEKARINDVMRNNGYFEFNERFIDFEVRYAPGKSDLWVTTVINKPADKPTHQTYQLDSVIFNTNGSDMIRAEENLEGIHYSFGNFPYSAKVLDTRLIFRPNETYNFQKIVNTQRQLLSMDMFKFVNINFDTTLVANKFVTNIYTSPLQKFQLTQEFGVNVSEGFPGPFYNLSLKNRNTFKGLEIFALNGFIGAEGIAAATEQEGFYRSIQYGANASVTFPRFVTPFNSRNLNLKTFNPRTTLSVGFAFTDRPEYTRSNVNGTFAFNWQNLEGNRNFTLNLADVNLIDTLRLDNDFKKQLEQLSAQGNTLNLAFNPSFVSSTSFNATYNNDYSNLRSPSSFLRWFVESGGAIYNVIGTGWLRSNELEFYQFLKLQIDYRKYWPLGNDKALVLRLNAGAAKPYSGNQALPYEKFFFTGGSSSNRAWNPRRLGPGSSFPYQLDPDGNNILDGEGNLVPDRNNYQFEQPGEILIETSIEYRTNLAGFLDWAFFIDAGNIWRFKDIEDPLPGETITVSKGADFKVDRFYKEFAIGAGMGMRLDFSFLVFRLDVGHKLRDPRFELGSRWVKPFSRSNQTVWNIAVGYPF